MKELSDRTVKQKQSDRCIREATCRVEIPVPSAFTLDNSPTVVFEHKDILLACAEMLSDPRVVSKPEDFLISANTHRNEIRIYTPEINSGDWWLRTMVKERLVGMENSMSLLAIILFIEQTNLTRYNINSF